MGEDDVPQWIRDMTPTRESVVAKMFPPPKTDGRTDGPITREERGRWRQPDNPHALPSGGPFDAKTINRLLAALTAAEGMRPVLERLLDYLIHGGGQYGGDGYECDGCSGEGETISTITHTSPDCVYVQGRTVLATFDAQVAR